MKRMASIVFIFMSCVVAGKSSDSSISDFFNIFRDKEHIELLDAERKDKLLLLRRKYFNDLQVLQEKSRELRKQANEYMIDNQELKYEEVHKEINKVKLEKKLLKENYRKKIDEILK